ncbi:hypothetical protein TWF694_009025 [Orbilia ellipsospora]|uniref:Uncharacterized protein n=1 Tax=Orbilia ellipsospora TaxID=2528407 RepID=A0AAV9XE81_9PEZI
MAYNYSYLSIIAAWAVAITCHPIGVLTINLSGTNAKFDNANPRNQWDKLKAKLPNDVYAKAQRSHAAASNGLEALGYWGLAVLAANQASVPVDTINKHALVFLALRVVYNVLYINISSLRMSSFRSAVWGLGIATTTSLLWKASQALNV